MVDGKRGNVRGSKSTLSKHKVQIVEDNWAICLFLLIMVCSVAQCPCFGTDHKNLLIRVEFRLHSPPSRAAFPYHQ